MLNLKDLTLVCIDSTFRFGWALEAIHFSMCQCNFAAVKFFTHHTLEIVGPNAEVVHIPEVVGKDAYSRFVFYDIHKYIDTSHFLIVQHDGYVIDASAWDDRFYDYDYIGPKWWANAPDIECTHNVGCGGFSMRSKKLHKLLSDNKERFSHNDPEDTAICRDHRPVLEAEYGIKYAPEEIADKFAWQDVLPTGPTFGYHQADSYYDRCKAKYSVAKEIDYRKVLVGPEATAYTGPLWNNGQGS